MPENEGSASMFETVKNHEERITILEKNDKELKENFNKLSNQILTLESQNTKLENTLLNDNRDTRQTMKDQAEKMFALVENAMGYQNSKSTQDHELKMLKLNTWSTVFLKFAGAIGALGSAGGLIYLVAQHFLSN
ncbi:hypothetical protein MKZ17_16195 [Solibacillus sp. FSL R7-0682]|uniref:hypothetical protein n=1 Tax=Solibacillus sp. FSL R7-0682 TaxID=2921690 RepID=UPI0030FB1F75